MLLFWKLKLHFLKLYPLFPNIVKHLWMCRLASLLFQNPVMETFVQAFSRLGQPCMMLYYFVNKLKKLIEEPRTDYKSLSFVYSTMMKELFSTDGKVFEDIKKFQTMLQKAETKVRQGNKSVIKDLDIVLQSSRQMMDKMKPRLQVKHL